MFVVNALSVHNVLLVILLHGLSFTLLPCDYFFPSLDFPFSSSFSLPLFCCPSLILLYLPSLIFFFGVNFVPSPQISTFCSDLLGISFFPCDAVWSCYILSFLARFLCSMCKVQPFVAKQTEATLSCVISPHWLIVNGLERVNQHRSNLLRVLEKASLLFLLSSYPLLSAVFCFWMGSNLLVFLRFPSIKGLFYFLSSRKFGYLLHHLLVFYKRHFYNP